MSSPGGAAGRWTSGLHKLPALLAEAGFAQIESGAIRLPRLAGFSGAGFVQRRLTEEH